MYLARQVALGRLVAVKILGSPALTDPSALARFERECRAVGSLSWHPHVVTVHDTGTTRLGQPFLTMEHHPAGSVQDRLDTRGPLSWDEVVRLGQQVGDALHAAHTAGVLHRDVKPANVLVDRHGRFLLADFGIARLVDHAHTASGVVAATVSFAAPEVLAGGPATPLSDLYSLGLTLYSAASGHHPFLELGADAPLLAMLRVDGRPPPPLAGPPGVVALIEQLLARDPALRPRSAAEVRDRFAALAAGAPGPVAAPRAPPARPTRRRRWVVAAVLGSVLLVGALTAALVAVGGGDDERRSSGPRVTIDPDSVPLGTLPTDPGLAPALLPDAAVAAEVGPIPRAEGGGRLFTSVRADITAPCRGQPIRAVGLAGEAARGWDAGDGLTTLQSVGQEVSRFAGSAAARRFVAEVGQAAETCGFSTGPVGDLPGTDEALVLVYDAPPDVSTTGGPADAAWILARRGEVVLVVIVTGDLLDQADHAEALARAALGRL